MKSEDGESGGSDLRVLLGIKIEHLLFCCFCVFGGLVVGGAPPVGGAAPRARGSLGAPHPQARPAKSRGPQSQPGGWLLGRLFGGGAPLPQVAPKTKSKRPRPKKRGGPKRDQNPKKGTEWWGSANVIKVFSQTSAGPAERGVLNSARSGRPAKGFLGKLRSARRGCGGRAGCPWAGW